MKGILSQNVNASPMRMSIAPRAINIFPMSGKFPPIDMLAGKLYY